MKNYLVFSLLLLQATGSFALEKDDINIQGGIGVFGSRGLLGVSVDHFLSPNHAISYSAGIDFVGMISSVGYKYFDKKIDTSTTNTFLDRCYFLVDCDVHPYVGASLQYGAATSRKFNKDGFEKEYITNPEIYALAVFGFRNIFKNKFTLDLEISYRNILTEGRSRLESGPAGEHDHQVVTLGHKAAGISIAAGYLF
jgi:outer membrane protein W